MPQVHRRFNSNHQAHGSQEKYSSEDRCNQCCDSKHVQDLDVQLVDINTNITTGLVISVACATRKKNLNTRES